MSAAPESTTGDPPRPAWLDLRHPLPQLALIAVVTLAAYGRSLNRYFVSEDFTILGVLFEKSVWTTLWTELGGSWLGITLVKFYRPLSTVLLDAESLIWGTWAPGYVASHVLLHLVGAGLLFFLMRTLVADRLPALPATVALLFAVYPLQPNAVLFIGSYATLFSVTACLASLLLFVRSRRGSGRRAYAGSLAFFALGLGCYEAAAVLPALVLALDLLFPPSLFSTSDLRAPIAWRALAARHLPFAGLLTGYLALRQAVLGAVIGGYRHLEESFLDLDKLLVHFEINWGRLIYPVYEPGPPDWIGTALALVVAAGCLWSLVRWRSARPAERLWLLASVWIVVAQLPFGRIDVLPADGRCWYFSAAGLALLIATAASAAVPRRWRTLIPAAAGLAVAAIYVGFLVRYVDLHLEAGNSARAVQQEILQASSAEGERIFVAHHPDFVRLEGKTPIAQVFHWGLSDALRPPFVDRDAGVYPLPRFSRQELRPILDRPDLGPVWTWDTESETLQPMVAAAVGARWPRIAVRDPGPGERTIRFEATGAERYRLILLTRGHPSFAPVRAAPGPDGWIEAPLPADFLDSMDHLYGSDVFWWIEAEDGKGRPTAFSELRVLDPAIAAGRQPAAPAPDVVLITVDTLRADRLGSYGGAVSTPNLDRLASEGALFEHAAAPMPETRPSHMTLFTSRYPRDHGVLSNASSFPEDALTLAEVYSRAGYLSAGFAACGLFDAAAGETLGFDVFDAPASAQRTADEVVPAAIEWLRTVAADRRVFLWLHLFDPHMPYQPPAPFNSGEPAMVERWPAFHWPAMRRAARRRGGDLPRPVFERGMELYDGEVAYADHWLGRFFEGLESTGRWDRTVVALTADHGECFSNGVFFDHSQCLSEGAIAVPLIVRYPPRIAAGWRVPAQVEHLDVAPALLRLSGLPVPREFLGRGLLARAADTDEPGTEGTFAFFEHPYYRDVDVEGRQQVLDELVSVAGQPTRRIVGDRLQVGARSGFWKYVRRGGEEALYDLRRDPGELDDLAAEEHARRDAFRLAVRRWMRRHPPQTGAGAEIHPELRKNLEALGYL